jgi:hypothetical protein
MACESAPLMVGILSGLGSHESALCSNRRSTSGSRRKINPAGRRFYLTRLSVWHRCLNLHHLRPAAMFTDQSTAQAFWLALIFSLTSLSLATFLFAWTRNRVLIWQHHTYRRYALSKKGSRRIRIGGRIKPFKSVKRIIKQAKSVKRTNSAKSVKRIKLAKETGSTKSVKKTSPPRSVKRPTSPKPIKTPTVSQSMMNSSPTNPSLRPVKLDQSKLEI